MADSFPFQFDTVHAGLTPVSGICHWDDEGVRCEFRKDFGGLGIKSEVKEARISYSEVSRCQFWKSWFSSGLRIYANSMKCLERFSTHEDDHLLLRVKRRDRGVAELAASEIELRAIDARRRQMEGSS